MTAEFKLVFQRFRFVDFAITSGDRCILINLFHVSSTHRCPSGFFKKTQ